MLDLAARELGAFVKIQSCKNKARRLQQAVAQKISEAFDLPTTDVKSLPMGSQGEDIWLSEKARSKMPFSIECKNVEKLNIHKAFEQAKTNSHHGKPLVVHTKNRGELLATLRFDDLLSLLVRNADMGPAVKGSEG